ncbi:MAG: aspartate/glutamate racemase family protein [Rectinema sp.]
MIPATENEGPILFLDSGVGGLPYLELARAQLQGRTLHYLADDAGFPYGLKSSRQVSDIVLDRVRRLRARFEPRALVIACNTASQAALADVRDANPHLEVIGTVPAVKPAAASTRTGVIGVLATARAVEDPYLDDLIARYAPGVEVIRRAAQDLVEFVEHRYLDAGPAERRAAVEGHVRALADRGADRIVLACTHFLHLEEDISACAAELYGDKIEVIDSRRGVVSRLVQVLGPNGRSSSREGLFLLSGEPPHNPVYARWATRYGLAGPVRL